MFAYKQMDYRVSGKGEATQVYPLYPVLRMRITSVNYQNNLITARGR